MMLQYKFSLLVNTAYMKLRKYAFEGVRILLQLKKFNVSSTCQLNELEVNNDRYSCGNVRLLINFYGAL